MGDASARAFWPRGAGFPAREQRAPSRPHTPLTVAAVSTATAVRELEAIAQCHGY